MSEQVNRRTFLQQSMLTAGAAGLGGVAGGAENSRQPQQTNASAAKQPFEMPTGKIKNLTVSRLISGGNLISGWSHSRDLRYISALQRTYNTEKKVLETLEKCEEYGINAIISDPRDKPMDIYKKHWDNGGKIQWIAEGHPTPNDLKTNVQRSIDWGASAIYVQGVIGDRWLRNGHIDKLAEVVEYVKSKGLPAGIGAHMLEVIIASETAGYDPDFYVKTLHHTDYWSARRPGQTQDVVENSADNYWSMTPEETIEFMKSVEKPWIAFKTLAAGAIHPRSGFDYAFAGGADFVCVGMFDFQVAEDAEIARDLAAKHKDRKGRPWRA